MYLPSLFADLEVDLDKASGVVANDVNSALEDLSNLTLSKNAILGCLSS